ncbi:Neuroguidin like [Actinidia chinensis var. chinensis]|uniref:Neuroguidin like n=1 Tax=Actinidia chinensis var. chinensis TaxID=1590841 RepID=A0A2R6PNT5_ACTCC|nr:Neuroguidin like [Actinidia chinensis var. chinensis]
MLLQNRNNGGPQSTELDLLSPSHGDKFGTGERQRLNAEIDSTCSTPYVSAPSSPGRGPSGYFFSAPASPMHLVLSTASYSSSAKAIDFFSTGTSTVSGSFEFEFSSKFSPNNSAGNVSMSSADELFLNGQIRPMKLSSHLLRPQTLAPLMDLEIEYEDEESGNRKYSERANYEYSVTRGRDLRSRNRSLHKKARSMSPLRSEQFQWHDEKVIDGEDASLEVSENKQAVTSSMETTPSGSAPSSRSPSSGRNSKKWIFLKDLLYRSKSEGRGNNKEKFWSSISFSSGKEKKLVSPSLTPSSSEKEKIREETERQKRNERVPARKSAPGKPVNGVAKRKVPPSAHELHYSANRAQPEKMKKKTFLPYRQGLLGCLGFSSKGYGAINGLAKTLNPVSSR